MAITLTQTAATHIAHMLKKHGKGVGLRFGVITKGCADYAYHVDYADDLKEGDTVFEQRGVNVIVDKKSLPLVDGTEIDFISKGLNSAFEFHNPNAEASCGCGESFNIKKGDEKHD